MANNKFINWRNKSNINFANIADHVKFINTVKYYQQILSTLAATMTKTEKKNIKIQFKIFMFSDKKLSQKFLSCTHEEPEGVLDYLSLRKGTIPYEMITRYSSLDIVP